MSEEEKQRETSRAKTVEAMMHRLMGVSAAVLGLVAVVVALLRMRTMFGISPLEALGIGSTGLIWVGIIVGLGILFSLGTSRIAFAVERVVGFLQRRKK